MNVVITPDLLLMSNKNNQKTEIKNLLNKLKKENIVSQNMSSKEFIIKCLARGINDFRKDLIVYDC